MSVKGQKQSRGMLPTQYVLLFVSLQWANMTMTLRGKQYRMMRMHFMPRCKIPQ